MKKFMLLFALCGVSSLTMTAQDDDLYFTPKKQVKATVADDNTPAYYAGSNRAVDEYNRRGKYRSKYQVIDSDSLDGDVISFTPGTGVYPDSTYDDASFADKAAKRYQGGYEDDDDYRYTRSMSRWDGYYSPWYAGWHSPFWYSRYGWYDPWYWDYAGWYYDPWYWGYAGWYDPWYWGGHWGWHGWYDPWYRPGWGGGVAVLPGGTGRTVAGTRNHGAVNGRLGSGRNNGSFSSRPNHGTATTLSPSGRFGSRSTNSANRGFSNSSSSSNRYSGSSSPSFNGSRSYSTGSSSSSGGGFSGSRSGGFSGGHSGGGRSGGGGGHFGGRR